MYLNPIFEQVYDHCNDLVNRLDIYTEELCLKIVQQNLVAATMSSVVFLFDAGENDHSDSDSDSNLLITEIPDHYSSTYKHLECEKSDESLLFSEFLLCERDRAIKEIHGIRDKLINNMSKKKSSDFICYLIEIDISRAKYSLRFSPLMRLTNSSLQLLVVDFELQKSELKLVE